MACVSVPASGFLPQVPVLTSLDDRLQAMRSNKPSVILKLPLVMVFSHSTKRSNFTDATDVCHSLVIKMIQ